jgi:23S rRNA (pseudouridine1915-N3)-methyltransferase
MKLHLITVGKGVPKWVEAGYQEYSQRMPSTLPLVLHEVKAAQRQKNANPAEWMAKEAAAIIERIPPDCALIPLDKRGKNWSTEDLAACINEYRQLNQTIAFIVGGPDGLCESILQQATKTWSLSALTFPHPLVRIIIAEQVYRAWTLLSGHPYHRS